jgi:hypothetical protein
MSIEPGGLLLFGQIENIHEKCDNSGYVSKSAVLEPSNECYAVCTLYREST